MTTPNLFILASDNSPNLLPLLRSQPSLASSQDNHGYSLLHAAASYNHHSLLRTLIHDFHVNPNIIDEDGETPLFVAETVATAQILLEEGGCDIKHNNNEGVTAEEKIRGEGDFVSVADYLREHQRRRGEEAGPSAQQRGEVEIVQEGDGEGVESKPPPPLPPNMTVSMETATEEDVPEEVVDPVFRAKIEELAKREDFQGEEGQRELKELIREAVKGVEWDVEGRDVKRRAG
ncbi:MAG: hypothetical protein Q9220_003505 [cf. Caloplaca sp. 1 TL-2023]